PVLATGDVGVIGAGLTPPTFITIQGTARSVNDASQIVGYNGSPSHGFLYDDGSVTTIDYPGAARTFPIGINNSGTIVGAYQTDQTHGYLYSGGTFTTLDDPLGVGSTEAIAINNNGDLIVGTYETGGRHGFV